MALDGRRDIELIRPAERGATNVGARGRIAQELFDLACQRVDVAGRKETRCVRYQLDVRRDGGRGT